MEDMSWSLRVSNGDLVLGGAYLSTVSGHNKLAQDLRCYLLEHMGSDPFNPSYGSLIDGGIKSDGTTVPSSIGQINNAALRLTIQSEIHRICSNYQAMQLSRAQADRVTYNKNTLTADELLQAVTDIQITSNQDTVSVNIVIQTAANQPQVVSLSLPGVL